MNKYIIITTTFKNKKEAIKIGKMLLSKRLISCFQLVNSIGSCNYKHKKLFSREVLMIMMSKRSLYLKIENEIINVHPYETPQIVACDIIIGYSKYLDWIKNETI